MKSLLLVGLISASLSGASGERFVPPPREIGQAPQLLLDRTLVAKMEGLRWVQHAPVPRGIALKAERRWEGNILYISSLFHLDGEYRMLYRAADKLCLATSKDGITWERPSLSLVPFEGSTKNNIIADGAGRPIGMGLSFLDPRPETPRDERVKILIWTDGERYYHYPLDNQAGAKPLSTTWRKGVRTVLLGSPDGRQFHDLLLTPELRSDLPNAFDGGTIFWSAAEGRFVGYFRFWNTNPRQHPRLLEDKGIITGVGVRSIFRMTSHDLKTWSTGTPMDFGESPSEHFYENSTFPYFRAPDLYIALANRFNPGRRALTTEEAQQLQLRSITEASGRRFTFASDCNDIVLMITRAATARYERPFLEAFMRPGLNPGNWTSRCNYAPQHGGVFPTGPDEMSFLVTRQHYQPENHIERMALRTDGFASLQAPYEPGEFVTVPLVCAGSRLEINYSSSAAGDVRAELQTAEGAPIKGFTLEECPPLIGDRIAGVVSWQGGDSLAALAGRKICLRIRFSDADVFSFQFTSGSN